MERTAFDRFTEDLREWAEAHGDVVGLVAAGSAAGAARQPDEWSDHDIWVVTRDGCAEGLRADLRWLPEPDRIVLTYRETAHGVGAIYDDGHLVEAAVFDESELDVARVNTYRVLVGGEDMRQRVARLRVEAGTREPANELGRFLTQLVIGVNRAGRGERMSAHAMVKGRALETLLAVIGDVVPPDEPVQLDDLDRHRRFEAAYPHLAASIEDALALPVPDCADALLAVAETALAPSLDSWPAAGVAAVRQVITRARAASA